MARFVGWRERDTRVGANLSHPIIEPVGQSTSELPSEDASPEPLGPVDVLRREFHVQNVAGHGCLRFVGWDATLCGKGRSPRQGGRRVTFPDTRAGGSRLARSILSAA